MTFFRLKSNLFVVYMFQCLSSDAPQYDVPHVDLQRSLVGNVFSATLSRQTLAILRDLYSY